MRSSASTYGDLPLRRFVVPLVAFLLLLGAATEARADDSSLWTEDMRDSKTLQRVSAGFHDLFHGKPRVTWDRGPVFATSHKAFAIHVGWAVQTDFIWYSQVDEALRQAVGSTWNSGVYMRRNRINVEGFFLRDWYVRVRYGWDGPFSFTFQDAFLEWSGLRNSRYTRSRDWMPAVRVGQVKEPMTLDWMNNAMRPLFAERGMFTTSIVPNRTPGIRLHGTGFGERMTYVVGSFGAKHGFAPATPGDGEALTGRVTGLPWAPKNHPKRLLHLGVSGTWRKHIGEIQFSSRPESWLGPNIVETGTYEASRMRSTAVEALLQHERFTGIVEAAWTRVTRPDGRTSDYRGWYGAVSYFLTPPGLTYDRTFGTIGRVKPPRPAIAPSTGWGALELTARYSVLDLDAEPLPGGVARGLTLGVNWYLRDNMRATLNYIRTWVRDAYGDPAADGTLDTLLLRLQYDL